MLLKAKVDHWNLMYLFFVYAKQFTKAVLSNLPKHKLGIKLN